MTDGKGGAGDEQTRAAVAVPSTSGADGLIGRTIGGKFRIIESIGVGAMGAIYRAEQTALGKIVAVKVLHQHLLSDPSLSQRFHREARMAARITHPHCITIHDFGSTDDGLLYIAMEHIDGRDLAQLVHDEHPLDLWRVLHIAEQVCSALDEAHNAGVIHRDLKPENIMVTRLGGDDDFVKVLDFGIAKPRDGTQSSDSFQTMAGVVCGTPEYMSPEQARGEELDARSDLYALGVVLFYLGTADLPFTGESPLSIVTRHLTEPAPPPRRFNPRLPESFNALVLELLAKRREERPPSALALRKRLQGLRERLTRDLDELGAVPAGAPAPREAEPRGGSERRIAQPTAQQTAVMPAISRREDAPRALEDDDTVTEHTRAQPPTPRPRSHGGASELRASAHRGLEPPAEDHSDLDDGEKTVVCASLPMDAHSRRPDARFGAASDDEESGSDEEQTVIFRGSPMDFAALRGPTPGAGPAKAADPSKPPATVSRVRLPVWYVAGALALVAAAIASYFLLR